jgi:hypothetical protein
MKNIVSVSLGSKSGDFTRELTIDGVEILLRREGTDGDWSAAKARIQELDGAVDAIGLGGIDIYLYVAGRQLIIGDGMRLKEAAVTTPVVDGSGLKNTLERRVVEELRLHGLIEKGTRVLMVSALDRFGMAESFVTEGCKCVFGDLIFNIGLDYPLTTLPEIEEIASKYKSRLLTTPFHLLYPTGSAQDETKSDSRYAKYYDEADIIAGDSHLILKHMPSSIAGKGIVTNTTRPKSIDRFANAGASWIMTSTPNLDGISGGTNIMEAMLVALIGKSPEQISALEYTEWIDRLQWRGSFKSFRSNQYGNCQ